MTLLQTHSTHVVEMEGFIMFFHIVNGHIMSNHLNGIKPSQQLNINLKIMFNTLNMYLG